MIVIEGPEELHRRVGSHLGYSDWLRIDQARIDEFARATGDFQWIHVDPDKARTGPFGATIAHGYLTLSLSNYFLPRIVEVRGFGSGVNYGVDKVRFPEPVTVGANVRAGAELMSAVEVTGGIQTTMLVTIEIDGKTKPACVIESLSRWLY